jgi:threonine dehydrogenase-like Zn-dependent dehydrogenase
MRAVRCSHGKVGIVHVDPPRGEGVRVKIAAAGICGSDLHLIALGFPIPGTFGHEMSGVTSNGTPVAIEPLAVCGICPACVSGAYNHCVIGAGSTLGIGRDGGMADEILVPERCLVALPAGLPVADACLAEPLAVAVHGIAMIDLKPTDRVAIVGGGSIGLAAVAVAREVTPHVALSARYDSQRTAGERLGATEPSGEYDIVIDCAGTSDSLADAVRLCRVGASVLLLATYWGGLTMPAFEVAAKELRIVSSSSYARHGSVRDFDIAAAILARNPAIASSIITHRMPLDAAVEAFALAGDRASGAIKVVLAP